MNPASDDGSTSRCHSAEDSDCGPAFESPCSRRGCTHVFTYAGTNPFRALAAMVAAHRRYCVGRDDVSTPRRCAKAAWQPPASLVQQFQARSSVQSVQREQALEGPDMDCRRQQADEVWLSPQIGMGCSDGDVAADSVTSGVKSRRTCGGSPVESSIATDWRPTTAAHGDPSNYLWHKIKRTARKEAERKALLEADPWVHSVVGATEVVCEGCRQTIKLDARSRYYPGLWEKHRDRCDGVRVKRAALAQASCRFVVQVSLVHSNPCAPLFPLEVILRKATGRFVAKLPPARLRNARATLWVPMPHAILPVKKLVKYMKTTAVEVRTKDRSSLRSRRTARADQRIRGALVFAILTRDRGNTPRGLECTATVLSSSGDSMQCLGRLLTWKRPYIQPPSLSTVSVP
ncbi:hypothetical protein GGX14DRAFT_610743 [Mycena pura]|uniref:Uncharacterized protein n=1 Tax=Mycena pura TaxID=153505 RepID=A0AAD6VMX0_9AGAR|nr:hypothetical protein GGX14DRAFT_610743 [Mycena pura]